MALRVNNNVAALNAYRNLTVSEGQQSKSLEKLSSGFRINRAADDAAGLSISEGLRSQVGGLKVASRNAQDGISVVQTAEGALTEVHSMLQRMRDLAVQAGNSGANGGAESESVKAANAEVTQLKEAITQIANTTQFNGKQLLDGANSPLTFQVGANAGETLDVNLANTKASGLGIADDPAATSFSAGSVTGGAKDGTDLTLDVDSLDLTSAKNFVKTTDADGVVSYTVVDDGADATEKAANLAQAKADAAGMDPADGTSTVISSATLGVDTIDAAIKQVSSFRGDLGAAQNRLEHTIANLSVTTENLSASESRIRDADMAQEMLGYTRSQILSQAGTAMLAQANQSSQGVLSLLQ